MYHVYILYSQKLQTFYKGHSADLVDRLHRHNTGGEKYTQKGFPWILVWSTTKESKSEAYRMEIKIKNLSSKRLLAFMLKYEAGVAGSDEMLLLKQLSEC